MPNSCKSILKIYEDRIQILLISDVLFDEDLQVEYTHGIKLGNTHFFRFVFHMDSNNRKVID